MPITVELQDMFSYSLIRIVLAAALVVGMILVGLIVFILKKKTKREPEEVLASFVKKESENQLKERYCAIINDLEKKFRAGKMSNRKVYQKLSKVVRQFVYELTGIKVHHHTLEEIKKLNMPELYAVIEECYAPEFSMDQTGSIYDTMNKARMVIKEWH